MIKKLQSRGKNKNHSLIPLNNIQYMLSKYKRNMFFFSSSQITVVCLLALKGEMVHHCAAVLQTCWHLRVLVWSYIPTWRAMASAGSPSCTALTATTNYRRSPCLETLPLLENCELKWLLTETVVANSLCSTVYVSSIVFKSHPISGMERTWLWLHLLR